MARYLFLDVFGLIAIVLCSCSGKNSANFDSRSVNVAKVQSLIFLDNDSDQENCIATLDKQSAKIIYKNSNSTVLTDIKSDFISTDACRGLIVQNQQHILKRPMPRVRGKRVDLPNLLKFIPAETIGARTFVTDNPRFDGRGVKIAILDTGVELDHRMLQITTTGLPKVIAVQDFSGEGDFELAEVKVENDSVEIAGQQYSVGNIAADEWRVGVFEGSALVYSEAIAENDAFEDVGVLIYKSAVDDSRWLARIDTDGDQDFADEQELLDTQTGLSFTKLGKNKTLTVSLTLSKHAAKGSLFFDDGGHGTHVAGIAAGFDPKGIVGVAGGAQVIGAKIGDNTLSGGSTTTAAMVLAIDYAVEQGADVINLSYGIRAGSNIGKSAIDIYVDKVAKEKDVLFAISAGNEGPGLLTVGTPAAARLAITNAAYLPKEAGQDLYGYNGLKRDSLWYFSSVGPLFDGGWKPTLLAPGTALSSLPSWSEGLATYSGTSMSSPQVTGGLALILSAAQQSNLPTGRAAITKAVYNSTKVIEELAWIEQGHGLMQVPAALEKLKEIKDEVVVEYNLSVTSPTSPTGQGGGIYVRSGQLPANPFDVRVAPEFAATTTDVDKKKLKSYILQPSAEWIKAPNIFYLLSSTKSFKVLLDPKIFARPGLHSEKITAIEESTGEVAFEVPVTVVIPNKLSRSNGYQFEDEITVEVGGTQRIFLDIPAGTTALQVSFESDSSYIWGQLLDTEGRALLELTSSNRSALQPRMFGQTTVVSPGVYELDLVSSPSNPAQANVAVKVQAYSLNVIKGPQISGDKFEAIVSNHFAPLRLTASVRIDQLVSRKYVNVQGNSTDLSLVVSREDKNRFEDVSFQIKTAKSTYDQMTDFPYMVLTPDREVFSAGALELDTAIELGVYSDLEVGEYILRVVGAFTQPLKADWGFELITKRTLLEKITLLDKKITRNLELGQKLIVPVDFSKLYNDGRADMAGEVSENAKKDPPHKCATVAISDVNDQFIQTNRLCL